MDGNQGDSIVLEEEIDPDYEPTEDEVLEYAKWLGMDLDGERDLFWIAREGLKVSNCHHSNNSGQNTIKYINRLHYLKIGSHARLLILEKYIISILKQVRVLGIILVMRYE